jgi:hypothetical protein
MAPVAGEERLMSSNKWLAGTNSLRSRLGIARREQTRRRRTRYVCDFQRLEERQLLTTYSVTSAGNPLALTLPQRGTGRPLTYTVTSAHDSGAGTLRTAILRANRHAGLDSIVFDIPGSGVHTISLKSPLPAITSPLYIGGGTQHGSSGTPLIELNGAGAGKKANGLVISVFQKPTPLFPPSSGAGSIIDGLAINRFGGAGIKISTAGGNTVYGCFIGTDPSGTIARGNKGPGILITDSSTNTIRGRFFASPGDLISGNAGGGIVIQGSNSAGNVVAQTYIGTTVSGFAPLPNTSYGVLITGAAHGNTIGGTFVTDPDVISCNGFSNVELTGAATGNLVTGNHIGVNASGTAVLAGNVSGVTIDGAPANTVGGTTAAARNVIAGGADDVTIENSGATGNLVEGNYLGTDWTGSVTVEGSATASVGVLIKGASSNTIGGTLAVAGNLISGHAYTDNATNISYGVEITGVNAATPTSYNQVEGNTIGLDASGSLKVPNDYGVYILDASYNIIGGSTSGAGNVISGNDRVGVTILTDASAYAATGNQIVDTVIGTNGSHAPDGTTFPNPLIQSFHALGNGSNGVSVVNSPGTEILGNVIGENTGDGVSLLSSGGSQSYTDLTLVERNYIGVNGFDSAALPNTGNGVSTFNSGANTIAYNTIADNTGNGVSVSGTAALPVNVDSRSGDEISQNSIHDNGAGILLTNNGNLLENYPVINSATFSEGVTTLTGSLTSTPNTSFLIEFFGNSASDPSGYGEREIYRGSTYVTTPPLPQNAPPGSLTTITFSASFGTVSLDGLISATATDRCGNTSEFSLAVPVVD